MSLPLDPGLQPERTELAWRRTILAIGIGSLVAVRLMPTALGSAWWALVGIAGLIVAATLWHLARSRLRTINSLLNRDGDRGPLPGAPLMAALAAFAAGAGAAFLALIAFVAIVRS